MRRAALLLVIAAGCGFKISGADMPIDASADDAAADAPEIDAELVIDAALPIDGTRTDWYGSQYTHRRKLTIATNKLTGDVANFPVLVTLPTAVGVDLATGANDLVFVGLNNSTVYPHEVDTLNPAGNTTAWVKLSLTRANPLELWVYYGFPTAPPNTSSGNAVFGAFDSVHHLSNLGDSSGHSHTMTASGSPLGVTGAAGGAQLLDGIDDYLEMANSTGLSFNTTMSISAWIKVTAFTVRYQCIVCKGDSAWRMARADVSNGVGFGTTNGAANDNLNGAANVNNAQWHHIAGVMDGTKKTLYVDGVKDIDENFTKQMDVNTFTVRFGENQEASDFRYYSGALDEVRITSGALSADWINAEYVTVHDATFVTLGADEPY